MLNPVKLFLLTTGAVVVLAVAPFLAGKLVSDKGSFRDSELRAPVNLASSDSMAELPSPRPGAPVQALRTKMTEPPAKKPVAKSSTSKDSELPKPLDSKGRNKESVTASAKSETKTPMAEKPAATPKPELPYRAEVARAQEMLLKLGKFDGKNDGKLGPITQAAITAFQKKSGLPAKGEPDQATIKELESAIASLPIPSSETKSESTSIAASGSKADVKLTESSPSKADDPQFVVLRKNSASSKPAELGPVPRMTRVSEVKVLQEKLAAAKVYKDAADGKWGHNTIVAMKEFQEQHKLQVTGKPNKETWKKLNEIASGDWEVVKKSPSPKTEKATAKKSDTGIVITDVDPSSKKTVSKAPLTIAVTQAVTATEKKSPPTKTENLEPKTEPKGTSEELQLSQPAPAAADPSPAAVPVASIEPSKLTEPPSPSGDTSTVKPGAEVVVKVNADAGAATNQTLATPAAISETVKAEIDTQTALLENPTQPILLPVDPPATASGPASAEESITVRAPKREPAVVQTEPPTPSAPVEAANSANGPTTPLVVSTAATPAPVIESTPVASAAPVAPAQPVAQAPVVTPISNVDESELPPAASKAAAAKLEKDLAEVQARVTMVSNDPRYELEKYAPKSLETVKELVARVKRDAASKSPNSESARSNLRKIDAELEIAKQQCLKEKAGQKVAQVDAVYKEVKQRFGNQLGNAAKEKNSESSAKLADLMSKIDTGYTAMQADFKKGNYDPIVERCDGFKLQIEILGNEAAKGYLESELEKSKRKLSKETLAEIEELRGQNKYLEAATLLDTAARSKSSSASKRKS